MEFKHKSVLLEETIEGLDIKDMPLRYAGNFLPRGDLLA